MSGYATRSANALVVVILLVTAGIVGPAAAARTAPASSTVSSAGSGLQGAATDAAATATSQPETQAEYLTTFRRLNGTEAFLRYQEFEVIRSQVVLEVQVGEFTDGKRERMQTVLELLRTFREAVDARENGSNVRSLRLANETAAIADSLLEQDGGRQYSVLADLALDRFYEENGQALLERAEGIERTPERLRALEQSATAFRQAGAADRFSQLRLRIERTDQQYRSDLVRINDSANTTASFVSACANCDSPASTLQTHRLAVFSLYAASLRADAAAEEGATLATRHALSDRRSTFESRAETIGEYRQTLAVTGAGVLVGFSGVVALLAAIVTWRLMRWRRDLADAQAGDIVLIGEMLNA